MKVLVISGGDSDERKISLLSAQNVLKALFKNHHQVELFDFKDGFEKLKIKVSKFDVIFPVLHGPEGESGALQEFLEKLNVRFVGSDSKACKASWDKVKFKKFCEKFDIKTPEWFVLKPQNINNLATKTPFVVKPPNNGSSVDVYIVKSKRDLRVIDRKRLFGKYKQLLIEDYIDGIEVTVGILGDTTLPVIEIQPPKGDWFSYKNKYSGKSKEIPNAPSLSLRHRKQLQKIALEIHRKLGCRHFSRSDFIVNDSGIYALEINTIPGLTKESLFPKAVEAAGLSFESTLDMLIKTAIKKTF